MASRDQGTVCREYMYMRNVWSLRVKCMFLIVPQGRLMLLQTRFRNSQFYILQVNIRSVEKVSSQVIRKIEAFTEDDTDTRNIVHRTMMPQSPSK